jgi:hypothetical protein
MEIQFKIYNSNKITAIEIENLKCGGCASTIKKG